MAREPGRVALALALLALVAVTLAVFWQLPVLGRAYLPADLLLETAPWRDPSAPPPRHTNPASQDPIRQYFPGSVRFATLLATKGAFRWESALGCGEPLSIQAPFEADYPPARVAYRLLPAWAAHGTLAALHLFLAGAGMLFWARARGSRLSSALVAGIGYALAPWIMTWLETHANVVAWAALPWAFGCLERARRAGDLRAAAGASLAFGLGVLGGHLNVLELGLLAAGAFTLTTSREGERRTSFAAMALAGGGALLVAAARIVPAAVELAASGRERVPFEHYLARTGSLDLRRSLLLLFPDLLGNPVPASLGSLFPDPVSTSWIERGVDEAQANFIEMRPHVGTVVLVLALVGAFGRPRSRSLLALAAISFALSLATPLTFVPWALVPGFGATTPLRFLALLPLFLGPLVANGFDVLADESATARARALRTALGASAVFLLGYAILVTSRGPGLVAPEHAGTEIGHRALEAWLSPRGRALGRPLLFALATAVGVAGAALAKTGRRRRLARALVAGLLAFDLLEAGVRLQATCEPGALFPETPAIREVERLTGENGRALVERREILNGLLPYGIPTVGAYLNAQPARYMALLEALDPPRARQWLRVSPRLAPDWQRLLGVSAILATPGAPLPVPDVALVHSGEAFVFARAGAARGWLFPESAATYARDQREALDLCTRPGFSPLESVVLERPDLESPDLESADHAGPDHAGPKPARPATRAHARPVLVEEIDPENVRVHLAPDEPSVFVLTDNLASGYRVTLDGKDTPILPAFVAFRGVLVPAGSHELAFHFTPPGWPLAPVVSWAAGLGCVALLVVRKRQPGRS